MDGDRSRELPFVEDPCEIYARLRHLDGAALLDSGGDARGRWDIIGAEPDPTRGLHIEPEVSGDRLHSLVADWQSGATSLCAPAEGDGPPFRGGFIGHLSYELGRRLQGLAPDRRTSMPLAVVNYYPWAVVQDRHTRRSHLVGDTRGQPGLRERLVELLADPAPSLPALSLDADFRGDWSPGDYHLAFDRVQEYIRAGDCYQINLAQVFRAPYCGDLLRAYAALRPIARAPFSAFVPLTERHQLLCLSPERFLTIDDGHVETRPIKGTRPRYGDAAEDARAAAELQASTKERAENLMIVDLLRNDLGRYCETGSVAVRELFALESYATVHHLVSVVRGRLRADSSPLQLLFGSLPGGSITGAPKHRAMQIIDELEAAPRQAWCGTVFYYSRHGRLDSNIAIRTLFGDGRELQCWAGGGLVSDSRADSEYQEHLDKVGAFMRTLETSFGRA